MESRENKCQKRIVIFNAELWVFEKILECDTIYSIIKNTRHKILLEVLRDCVKRKCDKSA